MTCVDLPRSVAGEDLISACLSAAEDFGWEGSSKDIYRKSYSLGSVHEHQDYKETTISIKGRFGFLKRRLPAVEIEGIHRGQKQNMFFIQTGGFFGNASEDQVKDYLSKVSVYLGFGQNQSKATA